MKQYLELCQTVLEKGNKKEDRTNTGTISYFGVQTRYDLTRGFPLVTTKKIYTKAIIHELLWFLKGSTNIKYLQENNVNIWNEWADENGELGPVYGKQWRNWEAKNKTIDQIKNVIEQIKNDPYSRRLIVSAWNVGQIDEMALPPCHSFFQFYVNKGKLSCQLYQRSGDLFLGVPFNIASYSLLTHMIAQVCNLQVGEFIHCIGDVHIYENHLEQIKMQMQRKPFKLPRLELNPEIKNIDDFTFEDIKIVEYISHDSIKGKVAV